MSQPFATRYGFRSENLLSADQPEWLQIDLGRRRSIDRIVAMPAFIPPLGERGIGYGFPRRFKIEVSDDPEMIGAVTVVDRTTEDVANPGRFPEDFRIKPTEGRYVRMTSTLHFPVEDGFIWALEELLVLSGNQPVSIWNPVTASSTFERYPNWSALRVQDGQSTLGMPERMEPSPTRGYLSGPSAETEARKWIRIDLGTEHLIEQIRLLPVGREGFEMIETGSFPRGYRLELATDPDFEEVVWESTQKTTNVIGFPGDCAVVIDVPDKRARYLRLVTLDLWGDPGKHGYGLAEIQAYSGNTNVALRQAVTASDEADAGPDWSPAFVNDGFTSRHKLIELPDYLDRIGERRRLTEERDKLIREKAARLRTTGLVLGYGGGTLGGLALISCGWLLIRQRSVRRRAVIRLREQIARDLHDDVGSNLGGIALLSEMGGRHSADPRAREDFLAIREAAETSSQSMQDIVWLIERGNERLRELISRMRETTDLILGDHRVSLATEPDDFRDRRLSLNFRRHFFFAFKETLHNVRRHAGAQVVDIRIRVGRRDLCVEVSDDGRGFDPEKASPHGHGLANLRRRAERLNGRVEIVSRPGEGTRVKLVARLQTPRQ
ncbi:ATP-binding protein [Haloferula sp. A504]|uniref:galactose-binding domain-containing protein n=1 Tax=Haloferula sp. A504 TaxID=3373601 RepID=UPI0031C8B194|nr:discoidin domain-containing protein [Verrucomicrobiaceae bacterium E54]